MFLNLLPLNLQFFATDEGSGGTSDNWIDDYYKSIEGNQDDNGNDGKSDDKSKQDEHMIPKKRFDEVNKKYKELSDLMKTKQVEYDEMVKKVEEGEASLKEAQKAIEKGKERIKTLEKVIQGIFEAELEEIDEAYHELIPEDMSIEEKLDWLVKAKKKGLFKSQSYEIEIGGMSNPAKQTSSRSFEGLNPIQLLTMGYGQRK
jgi:exonuclease VII small subunit